MEAEIIAKLRQHLSAPVAEEKDLMYLLVQLRKLHKRTGNRCPSTLTLFCNWAVHHELDEVRWARLVERPSSPPLPIKFQREVNEVLASLGLPELPDVTGLLAGIVNDCPIVFSEGGERFAVYMYPAGGSWAIQRTSYPPPQQ